MKIERTKNTVRNSVWGIVSKIITTAFPVIVRTMIVRYMGAEYLGIGSLFSSILTVLSLAELGISTAFVFSMYKPIADDDTKTICALMALYKKIYSIIGCLVAVIGVSLMPFLSKLINGESPDNINIYILYGIYLGNAVIGYFLFAYKNCLLTAHHRTDISTKISIITATIQYCIAIFVIAFTKNYYAYAILAPIASIANNLITAFYVTKKFPNYKAKGILKPEILNDIKKRVAGLMLSKVAGTTRNTLDSIFISAFLGLTTVTMYGNYYCIMAAIISILAVITGGMSAGVGNSIAVETKEKNYNDLKKFTFIYGWLSGWCTICLTCLYQPAMYIWMGKDLMLPNKVVWLFSLYFYICTSSSMNSQYYNAVGLWWHGKIMTSAEAFFNLILNYLLGKYLGITGILLATIMTTIFSFIYIVALIYKYYFNEFKISDCYKMHIKLFVITLFNTIITYKFCSIIHGSGLFSFLLKCLICLIAPNAIYWIIYRNSNYYSQMRNMILGIIRK